MDTTTKDHNTNAKSARQKKRYEKARAVLEQGLDHVRQDEEALANYLRFRVHFRDYSRRNTLMIMIQRPTARFCMGYRQWQKHGRQVKKGEKGIMIWIPLLRRATDEDIEEGADPDSKVLYGWRTGHVFDYSQTKSTSPDALQYASPIPQLEGDDFAYLYDKLKALAQSQGFEVIEEFMTQEGYCNHSRQIIGVRASMMPHSKAITLAHELAHAMMHSVVGEGGATLSRAERELQAESVAYLVCYVLGLDTAEASLPYLRHYAGDGGGERLLDHLDMVEEVAWKIIKAVERSGGA